MMKRPERFLTPFLLPAFLLAAPLLAGCGDSPEGRHFADRFEPIAAAAIAEGQTPGLAVVAVAGGEVIYAEAFGERRAGSGDRLRAESLFPVADITQTFVATALFQMVEKGIVELDQPVVRYLPYFRLDDPRYGEITLRQLLEHTAGLPPLDRQDEALWHNPMLDDGALERTVRALDSIPLWSAPGAERRPSALGYDALGDVIAKVDGVAFEEALHYRIFKPLGMTRSSLRKNQAVQRLLAAPHLLDEEGLPQVAVDYPYTRGHAPGIGLVTSPEELGQWLLLQLNRGVVDGERILAVATFETLWAATWETRDFEGLRRLSQGGGLPGFAAHAALLPDEGLGVAILCNLEGCPAEALADEALRALLKSP
jgi:CubicO group peptidase (beta-lactamase class C family)